MTLYLGNNLISGVATPTEPTRNLGQIIESILPLTDAGLHLLDGALINGSGIYRAFVDAIADLVSDYPDLFETEANWQSAVSTYGVCGKFVYTETQTTDYYSWGNAVCTTSATPQSGDDVYTLVINASGTYKGYLIGQVVSYDSINSEMTFSVEGTNFTQSRTSATDVISTTKTVRLPKITGILEGTIDATALGDLVEAGLPNITGSFKQAGQGDTTSTFDNFSGAFYNKTSFSGKYVSATGTSGTGGAMPGFDASRSSSIYGNSNTVQPQTIKTLYYIVIATTTKTEIEVDIDEIATDLNGKADIDLTNVNNSGTSRGAGWAMPSGTNINLTLGASGSSYTAPADGWIVLIKVATSNGQYLTLYNNTSLIESSIRSAASDAHAIYIPVKKGDKVYTYYSFGGTTNRFKFVYAEGSKGEA